jgi:hypothetical protein
MGISAWGAARSGAGAILLAAGLAATPAGAQIRPQTLESGAGLLGQLPDTPTGPTPRGLDGRPDLTGYWKPLHDPGKPSGNLGKDEPGFRLPYSEAGLKALEYNLTQTRDPEALCILGGIPRHNGSILPFEILHTPKRLATLYVYNTHRFVAIDGRVRDPEEPKRYFGTAIGRWEGDTLVIETRGLHDSADGKIWLDENANPVSDRTVVIERWSRPDFDRLQLVMTVDDAKYYTRPFTFTRTWAIGAPGENLTEYACNENNITAEHIGPGPGPIGPDGNRGAGYGALPAEPPGLDAYDPLPATPGGTPR